MLFPQPFSGNLVVDRTNTESKPHSDTLLSARSLFVRTDRDHVPTVIGACSNRSRPEVLGILAELAAEAAKSLLS